ncbi:hypothetical protein BKA70DRAFT_1437233 [Coprinopsis sp. MPI-PUGE-AT-0042]|nr:hypothetical protein BKA70DRAFT_1437233 [Coprinopsis sp. MPI-PUGE-AT-0042]
MDDLEGADETSGLGSRSGSEMDSIDAELADMLTPDIEGDPSAGLGEIPAANRNTAGSITPGVRPEAVAKASIPPAISEDEDQGKLEAGPPPKKPRVESPPYEQVPAGGMHLKAADMSHVGNTPDTAIVLDQIDDDVLRRLPPRDSANLETSKRDKIHPPGMDKGETFYGPEGETFCWAPLFYNESDADGFVHWVSAIKESYCGTPLRPRHIAEPDRSAFVIQKEADFKGQSIRERQSVWGKPGKLAIVLTECAGGREVGFDKAGLESITGRMDAEIEVQDQSQPLRRGVNISKARSRRTTLQDMLRFSLLPLRDRPIVNALTFPLPPGLRPEQEFPFSSEHIAWLRTLGNHFCFSPYPTSSTRWSLVAFNGALHYFHIDSDGFGTWVEVKTGLKLWVVARPKDGSIPSFQDIDGFLKILAKEHHPTPIPGLLKLWFWGPILDLVGLIHTFIGEDFLTNTQHVESRFLLRRMVHFFHHAFVVQGVSYNTPDGNDVDDAEHLPNLADRDHFAATFALLSFIEMQNILDSRSYVIPKWVGHPSERLECIYTRGLATELARWIFSRFRLVSHPDTGELQHPDPWADFYWPYLAHFLSAIKAYKKKYPRAALSSLARVQKQIDHCVKGRPELVQALKAIDVKTISSISPPFTVSPGHAPEPAALFS